VKKSAGICWGSQNNTLKEIKSKGEFKSLDKNRIKEYNYMTALQWVKLTSLDNASSISEQTDFLAV
jgi:hypothetical protein